MFSAGSKISLKTDLNKFANFSRPQSGLKILTSPQNKMKKVEVTSGPFLNIDYDELYRQPEIKDKKVKKILDEVNGFGPYYTHCNSCNKKNLDFYSKMDSNSAVKMLRVIKNRKTFNLK